MNYKIFSAHELLDLVIKEEDNLWESYLPRTGLVCIYGASDTGKSSFLRLLCLSIVAGFTEFLKHKLNPEKKAAIYVSTEDGKLALKRAMEKQVTPEMKTGPTNLHFVIFDDELIEVLKEILKKKKVDIIVIDAWADTYLGSMNEANKVRANLNEYAKLAEEHQCLIVILHHMGKRTEHLDPDKNNLLGSQAIEAKCRVVLEFRGDKLNPKNRYITVVKANHLPYSVKSQSLKLEFHDDLSFTYTGQTVDKTQLATITNKRFTNKEELVDKVIQYHRAGKSVREIEIAMQQHHKNPPKKSTISEWITDYNEEQLSDNPDNVEQGDNEAYPDAKEEFTDENIQLGDNSSPETQEDKAQL